MKKVIYVIFIFFILSVTLLSIESKGSLFIISDNGFRVYLDGDLKGVTSKDTGGLWLQDLSPGILKVKMQKQGFNAILFKVNIVADETLEKTVDTNTYKIITEKDNNPFDYINYIGIYVARFDTVDRGFIIKFKKKEYVLLAFDEEYAYYRYVNSEQAKTYQYAERKALISEVESVQGFVEGVDEYKYRDFNEEGKAMYDYIAKHYYKKKYSIDFERKKIILEGGLFIDIITKDRFMAPQNSLFDISLTFNFLSNLDIRKLKK